MRGLAPIVVVAALAAAWPGELAAQGRDGRANEARRDARASRDASHGRAARAPARGHRTDRVVPGGLLRHLERELRIHGHRRAGHRVLIIGRRPVDRTLLGRGRGPAFCRSGAGHPVFGRGWCLRKGFGLGGSRFGHLEEILFRRHGRGTFGHAALVDVLGHATLDYLLHDVLGLAPHRGRHLTGRWHDSRLHGPYGAAFYEVGYRGSPYRDALALQLYLDGDRVAELIDFDRDGRVDLLLIRG